MIVLTLFTCCSYAWSESDDDEFAIKELARTLQAPVEEIRSIYTKGGESGRMAEMRGSTRLHQLASEILLNRYFNSLKGLIKDDGVVEKLVKAEKAWLKYRDENCAFDVRLYPGPRDELDPQDKSAVILTCRSELADQRIDLLKQYISYLRPEADE